MTLPTRIDEVIVRLDEVVERGLRERSRLAFFACLYRGVTDRVATGIREGRFEDWPRMERPDCLVEGLARPIRRPGPHLQAAMLVVRAREPRDVESVVRALR